MAAAYRFMLSRKVPSLLVVGTVVGAFSMTAYRMYDFMSLNKKIFPRPDLPDGDPQHIMYQKPSLADSREMAKRYILSEIEACYQSSDRYLGILDELHEQSSEAVKERGVAIVDDSYTQNLANWLQLLQANKLSSQELTYLYHWLNRENGGMLPVQLAMDDCAVEASKNPHAVAFNFLKDPSRSEISHMAIEIAQE